MLDVIHYLFEADAESIMTAEQAEGRNQLRSSLYSELYNRSYEYSTSTTSNTSGIDAPLDDDLLDDMPTPVDPFARSRGEAAKPYIPPTKFDPNTGMPMGSVLDAPLR